jgi:3-dehydroquinate dehydratase
MRLMLLNGPNLNLLGVREPHIYGSTTLAAIEQSCRACAEYLGATLAFHQSNHEGELVDLIQSARQNADALIINLAAYSFTSIAIYDALKTFEGPIIELTSPTFTRGTSCIAIRSSDRCAPRVISSSRDRSEDRCRRSSGRR